MRLKRLELVGFKTFADATELAFDRGVTAIIGPNGSGKSNCADALLWVLAERRLSALRATEGTDVIFAGSARRKPLGYAEVSLTVDNEDGSLPVEFREVRVTRRTHRNGDNDYLINGRRCRRKDVVDLFLDTGVGRESFTVISQREIDAVLSADAHDRRRMLEEVAGIERYRARRDETIRRLNDTAANLTRLGDLMVGLELQLGPLAEQRVAAQRFVALRDRAERLKLSLLVKDYQLLERRILRSDEELAGHNQALTTARTALAAGEAAEQQARLDLLRADEDLATARAALGEAAQRVERHQTEIQVHEERLRSLATRLSDANESLTRQAGAGERLAAEAEANRAETAAVEAELAEARAKLTAAEAGAAARRAEVETAERRVAAQRQAMTQLTSRHSVLDAARQAARRTIETVDTRREGLLARAERAAGEAERAAGRAVEAETGLEAAQAASAAAREAQQAANTRLQELDRRRTALRDAIGDHQAKLGEARARLQVLQAAHDNYEGLYQGVKAVLRARDRQRLRGDYHVVADVMRVEDGCEVAIEAALGPRLQDLICETAEDARAGIDYLKQDRSGRATFLPLDMIDAGFAPRGVERLRQMPGVVGPALDLVTCDPEFDHARRHLLSSIVVVEDIEAGISVRRAGFDRVTIVTLDGDLIRTSGAMTGGSRESRGPTLLSRKRDLDRLEQDIRRAQSELDAARSEDAAAKTERQTLAAELTAHGEALEKARRAQSEAERRRLEARSATGQAEAEQARLAESLAELAQDAAQAEAALAEAETELAGLEQRRADLAASLNEAETEASRERSARQADADALSALRVEVVRRESRLHALKEAAANQRRAAESARDERGRLERAQEVWRRETAGLESALRDLRRQWEEHRAAQEEHHEALSALTAMRKDAAAAVETSVAAARTARQAEADAQDALHRAELRRMQADTELNLLRQTLADEHDGMTPEQAAEHAEDLPNRQEAANELQSLRAEMDAMGDVNLGAIEEYERISEQLLFYDRQKADLEQARGDLLRVIAEIDELTEVRLAESFVAVNREFGELFHRVFGDDGEAELRWSDPEDILESGLEVLVRLPGKRAQNILLLSGGERAMTTVTLLLAMFRIKPSPFCLVDELDAPLDAANVGKYVELLREFSAQSQFIVITHNPETTRAADTLYGITMPEPGVSRAYSHRPPVDHEVETLRVVAAD